MITFKMLGKMGRFGNQLFQVASTIGIAERLGYEWAFPKWDHPFVTSFPEIDDRFFNTRRVPLGYRNVKNVKGDYTLRGYMQSERYFKHCEEKIRKLFTISAPLLSEFSDDFISIHVRRGDYNSDTHAILGAGYYEKALSLLPPLPRVIFTDDIQASKDLGLKPEMILNRDAFFDFSLMTRASHHVIANSTFSWWSAWLANSGKVIAPADWFGPKRKRWSTNDIYPEGWEVIR